MAWPTPKLKLFIHGSWILKPFFPFRLISSSVYAEWDHYSCAALIKQWLSIQKALPSGCCRVHCKHKGTDKNETSITTPSQKNSNFKLEMPAQMFLRMSYITTCNSTCNCLSCNSTATYLLIKYDRGYDFWSFWTDQSFQWIILYIILLFLRSR